MPDRRRIKNRELLAIQPEHVRSEPGAMWWDTGVEIPENEQIGSVCVVHVRGALEHHSTRGSDSYDDVRERVHQAMCNEESTSVILCIDSPGGVVSGLNETVFALRRMAEEHDKPLIAHIDGLCASAGYALSCACSEFYLTASAITGSVGVISMIVSQEKADRKAGIDVVTIKSGSRKDDGHVHVPISDAAVAEEQRRVDKLAQQFFRIVATARGLSPAKVESFQAGIFLGKEAVKAGLADAVLGFDKLVAQLNGGAVQKKGVAPPAQLESTSTENGTSDAKGKTPMTLNALLRQTKAALAKAEKAKDTKAIATLSAAVASYQAAIEAAKRVKKTVKYEMESTDEGDEDEAAEESEEESEKGNETDRKEGDDSDDSDDGDSDDGDDDGDEEDEEEEEAEEAEASEEEEERMSAKGKRKMASVAMVKSVEQRLAKLERDTLKRNTDALIAEARAARRITPGEAKQLAGKSRSFVRDFLSMRKKPLVNIDEESALAPDPRPNGDLPSEVLKQIDLAVSAVANLDAKGQEDMRKTLMDEHRKQRANGAGARH